MDNDSTFGLIDALAGLGGAAAWLAQNIAMAVYNLAYALGHPALWLDWSNAEAISRVVYYGGSSEFFFVMFTAFLTITALSASGAPGFSGAACAALKRSPTPWAASPPGRG